MPSLRELKTKWQVRFYDASQTPPEAALSLSKSEVPSRREAEKEVERLTYEWKYGSLDPWAGEAVPDGAPRTIIEGVERYVGAKLRAGARGARGGWTEGTRRGREPPLRALARSAGPHRLLHALMRPDIEAYVYREELARATRRSYHRLIKAWVRWLEERGWGPGTDVLPPAPQKQRKLPTYATEEELERICTAHRKLVEEGWKKKHAPARPEGPAGTRLWMNQVFRFAFYNGMRRGEIMALRVRDVDLARSELRVGTSAFQTKEKAQSLIPLVPPARALIRKACEGRGAGERVFGHRSAEKVSKAFREAARRAVPEKADLHFHSLRHSCGVYWRRRGLALTDLRDLFKHASVRTTEIYEQLSSKDLGARFEKAFEKDDD